MAKKTTDNNEKNNSGTIINVSKSSTNKKKRNSNDKKVCHICGRPIGEVTLMYTGISEHNNYVCADCIEELHLLNQSLAAQHNGQLNPERAFEEEAAENSTDNEYAQENLTPKKMVEYLE